MTFFQWGDAGNGGWGGQKTQLRLDKIQCSIPMNFSQLAPYKSGGKSFLEIKVKLRSVARNVFKYHNKEAKQVGNIRLVRLFTGQGVFKMHHCVAQNIQ